MSRYDDDTIVALLRDSVPAGPEVADRVGAIRVRAGRQRAALWTQALGAVASVLLIVGVAAAMGTPAQTRTGPVAPVEDPLAALRAASADARSVYVDARMEPVGQPSLAGSELTPAQLRDMLTSHVVGALSRDGDAWFKGDFSFFNTSGMSGAGNELEMEFRLVDGESFQSVPQGLTVPAGKTWIRTEGDSSDSGDVDRMLRMLAALAEDVRYVGQGAARGTPVAEYRMTLPKAVMKFGDVEVRFALDAESRLRRVWGEVSWLGVMEALAGERSETRQDPLTVRIEIDLYDWDRRVDVAAPPADKVVTQEDLTGGMHDRVAEVQRCTSEAGKDFEAIRACHQQAGYEGSGFAGSGTYVAVTPVPASTAP